MIAKFLIKKIPTGQVKGNLTAIALAKPLWGSSAGPGPNSEVITSPNVHGEVASILTWYSLRHTRKRGLQSPSHSKPEGLPEQHLPVSSFPAWLSKDSNLNSNTPDAGVWKKSSISNIYSRFNEHKYIPNISIIIKFYVF